jgi:hypothetical protein
LRVQAQESFSRSTTALAMVPMSVGTSLSTILSRFV